MNCERSYQGKENDNKHEIHRTVWSVSKNYSKKTLQIVTSSFLKRTKHFSYLICSSEIYVKERLYIVFLICLYNLFCFDVCLQKQKT